MFLQVCFTENQAAQVLTDITKAWLAPSPSEEFDTQLHTLSGHKPRPAVCFVAEMLGYLHNTIMLPQFDYLGHMPYFGEHCFISCLGFFEQQTYLIEGKGKPSDIEGLTEGPWFSPFAICIGQSSTS